ncbi:MAG: TIGR03067 domain-containing protein [Tepidisphaerales bacterium]
MPRSRYLALFLAMSLSCLSRGDATKDDAKSIDGTWLPSAAELGGEKFPEELRKTLKLVIGDGKYTVTAGKETDRGTVKLDPSAKPRVLDITGTDGPNRGKTILAIYEKTEDTLRICYDLSGGARPTEFKTKKGTQQFLVTYDRKKP